MSNKNVGIWVDHHKAIIVKLDVWGSADISELDSAVSSSHRSTGGTKSSRPFWHRSVFSGRHQTEHRVNDLHKFYENIAAEIKDAERVWIFGPSTAHHELASHIKEKGVNSVLIDESAAFMSHTSQTQIVEHVRKHFHKLAPRNYPVAAGQPEPRV